MQPRTVFALVIGFAAGLLVGTLAMSIPVRPIALALETCEQALDSCADHYDECYPDSEPARF